MAARMIEDAFFVINPAVRLEKIYRCLIGAGTSESRNMKTPPESKTPVEPEIGAHQFPAEIKAHDRHNKVYELWCKLGPDERTRLVSDLRSRLSRSADPQKAVNTEVFIWETNILTAKAAKPKAAAPPPAKVPRKSLSAEVASRASPLSSSDDSTVVEVDDDGLDLPPPAEPEKSSSSSRPSSRLDDIMSDEESGRLVEREIQEVLNVGLRPRTKEGRVMLYLRHTDGTLLWMDAKYLLDDLVIDHLREVLQKI
jgi:hypothetical protein